MKKILLFTLILLLSLGTKSFADRSWNFRSLSQATLTNLAADPTNWNPASVTRFNNLTSITAGSVIKANGVEIAEIKGLTFGTLAADKLRLDFNTNPGRLMLNGSGLILNIPDCLVGDTIYILTMTGSTGTARGVTASANCTRLNADATSADSLMNKFLVTTAGVSSFTTSGGLHFREIKVKTPVTYIFNEAFGAKAVTLPTGWAANKYYAGLTTTGINASASAVVDTLPGAGWLYISGSGSGNRGVSVDFPTSGTESMVDIEYDWFTGNPGSEANKMVDMNFTDASGNSILYLYAENWTGTGVTNHLHCLNLDPTVIPSGANRDVPLVAIAANTNTLFGKSTSAYAFGVNTNWYNIKARFDFVNKKIVSITVTSNGQTATASNLPFISSLPASVSKLSCATYRNAASNNNGTGSSGNGSNAYLAYKIDNFKMAISNSGIKETYYKAYNTTVLGDLLTWVNKLAAGTTPETGLLGYKTGSKVKLTNAIAASKAVYDNAASTSDQLMAAINSLNAALTTFDASKNPIADDYLLNKAGKFLIATDASAAYADTTALGSANAQKQSTLWAVKTDANGYVSFVNGIKYLQMDGKTGATATSYRMVINDKTFKLNKVGSKDFFAIGTDSVFSLFTLTIPIKPIALAKLPSGTAVDTTGAVIKVSYNQSIKIKSPNGLKVNGVVTPATVVDKDLIFNYKLAIKTDYTVTIDSAAIVNKAEETLVANALSYSFHTYSPYLRDKQTMLGSGTFVGKGVYALFGPGSANGYTNTQKQIAGNKNDSLKCDLSNSLYSQWYLVLADSVKNIWNVKNYASGKYLSYKVADSTLVMSSTPTAWQVSLNASAPADNDYENVYTFWPSVDDKNLFYDYAIRVDSMRLSKVVANGTVTNGTYRICPMESLTYGTPQNFTTTSYVKIGARNTGERYYQIKGDPKIYFKNDADHTVVAGGHWKISRKQNGRYVFQNRLTGQYLTYINDSTLQTVATYTAGSDDQEWVIMFHCSKDATNFYTIQGRRLVLYGGSVNGGYGSLTMRNAGNATASAGGAARMCLVASGVTYVQGEGQPVINVSSVTAKSVTLSWNQNKEAAKYVVRGSDQVFYSNGDSIGVDPVTKATVYKQIPYIKDSLCIKIDTVSDLTYKFPNLKTNVDYYFTVQAVDPTNLLGLNSDVKAVQTVSIDKFTPAAPTVGTVTMKTVEFRWVENPEAVRYTLYYWTKPDSSDLKAAYVTTTSYVVTNIPASTTVYASLVQREEYLWSKPSAIISATTLPYSTLKMTLPITSNVKDYMMNISWDEAVDAVSYNVYYSDDITKISSVTPVNVPSVSMYIGGLKANTNYYIQVCAVNNKGALSSRSSTKVQKTASLLSDKASITDVNKSEMSDLGVIAGPSSIRILNAQDKVVTVYSITGKKIYSQMVTSSDEVLNTELTKGLYMVKVDDQTIKALIK
jgi:hypothetical protein